MHATPRRTQEQRSSAARQRLIGAGIKLIGEQGYEATSLGAIGQSAGYSRGLVTHHFGSKEVFAEAVFSEIRAQFTQEMREAIAGLDGVEALDAYIARYLSVGRRAPDVTRCFFILTTVAETSAPSLSRLVLTHSAQVRIELMRLLGRVSHGIAVPDDVDLAGLVIVLDGALRGVVQELVLDASLELSSATTALQAVARRALSA